MSYAYHISKRRIFYADYENMQFNEIERNLDSQNFNSNLQRDRLKNTMGKCFHLVLCILCQKINRNCL